MSTRADGKRTLGSNGSRGEDRRQDLSSRELRLDFSLMQLCHERGYTTTRHLCRLSSPIFVIRIVLRSQ
jgi:hypothetical protein